MKSLPSDSFRDACGLWTEWPLSICNLLIGLFSTLLRFSLNTFLLSFLDSFASFLDPFFASVTPVAYVSYFQFIKSYLHLQMLSSMVSQFSSVPLQRLPLQRSYWFHTVRRLSPPFTR